jgi:hypothetical protein
MICHIVLIRLKADVSVEDADAFMAEAKSILGPIPGVKDLRVGKGLGVKAEKQHPIALVMEFDDDAALAAYQVHPEHQRFVNDVVGPIQDDKQVYDYRY